MDAGTCPYPASGPPFQRDLRFASTGIQCPVFGSCDQFRGQRIHILEAPCHSPAKV